MVGRYRREKQAEIPPWANSEQHVGCFLFGGGQAPRSLARHCIAHLSAHGLISQSKSSKQTLSWVASLPGSPLQGPSKQGQRED